MIDTIVAKVQGVPGDDMCVLLLGYPDQMETMMREANPGLARRFQLSQAWLFEDYSQEDLLHIMKNAALSRWVPGLSRLFAHLPQPYRELHTGSKHAKLWDVTAKLFCGLSI